MLKNVINSCCFLLFLISFLILSLSSCKEKRHHLIEDVTNKIRHKNDTVGVSYILRQMHGVWVERKYLSALKDKRSITEANKIFPSGLTVLNLDTRHFLGDSLPFVGLNTNDFQALKGCVHFYREKNGRIEIEMDIHNKNLLYGNIERYLTFEPMEFDDFLVIEQDYGANFGSEKPVKDRYIKVSEDVSDKIYQYDPLFGIEVFTRRFLKGSYNVYNEENRLVMKGLFLNEDGTISNHPFAKYRLLAWTGFDALMIQGLPIIEEQNKPNGRYFGLKRRGNSLLLYQIIKDTKTDQIRMGNLLFTMKRRK